MKDIVVDFYPENLDLIYEGLKVSTIRTEDQSIKMALDKDESGIFTVKDKKFVVKCLGLVNVDEIGGREQVWRNEGFLHTSPKFHSTWMFLLGKRDMFYYDIKEYNEQDDQDAQK